MKILNMLGTLMMYSIVYVICPFFFACALVGVQPWRVF